MIQLPFFSSRSQNKIVPVVLLVLDGFGIAPDSVGNAISRARTPNLDDYRNRFLYGELIAAGESVGLPANEDGNSEVGHLTLGAGRVVNQSLVRINKSIEDGSFFDNTAFMHAIEHSIKLKSKLHIMGMVGTGSVHSSVEHLYALIELCKRHRLTNVCFHLFTDGRDSAPTCGIESLTRIENRLIETGVGTICTVMGRYWAMDRDARWERTQIAYDALTLGKGIVSESILQAVQDSYNSGKTDEFIEPIILSDYASTRIDDNDSVVFYNFRIDRPRQLSMAFVISNFESLREVDFGYLPHELKQQETSKGPTFSRTKIMHNLYFVTMTEYQNNLPVSEIAFPPSVVKNSMPEVLASHGMRQYHLAESEKERMVAFYFDGLREERYPGEEVKIVPSPSVSTYDKKPQMSVFAIVKQFKKALDKDMYHFFVMNFANPDMVAHSGNLEATIRAVEYVDKAIGSVVTEVLKLNGIVGITADHGNAEELLTFKKTGFYFTTDQGGVNTEHSNNPVPFYLIGNTLEKEKFDLGEKNSEYDFRGALQDVAPTMLKLMNIEIPSEMQGQNLLASLKRKA